MFVIITTFRLGFGYIDSWRLVKQFFDGYLFFLVLSCQRLTADSHLLRNIEQMYGILVC